ncbi:MAG: NHL repeat-containing protein [Hyphomicrobiaceae bacterium]
MGSAVWIGLSFAAALAAMAETGSARTISKCVESRPEALDNPQELRLSNDGRRLFVAETDKDRIAILDPTSLRVKSTFGGDQLDGVHDIDVDTQGRLYAADTHNNRVAMFDIRRNPPQFVGELRGGISRPESVAVHPNGTVYVSGAWSRNVVAFRSGRQVAKVDGLSAPRALAIDRDGRVFVVVSSREQIFILSPDLAITGAVSARKMGASLPSDIQAVRSDVFALVEKSRHRFWLARTNGEVLTTLGTGRPGQGAVALRRPGGVEMRASHVWIADSGNNRILRCALEVSGS